MQNIKILSHLHMIPKNNHITVYLINNLLKELRKKSIIHMFCVVYTPEKQNLLPYNNSETTLLDIHNFENAVFLKK